MTKPKTVLYLSFGIATVKRLASPAKGGAFCDILAAAPSGLLPTHFGYSEPFRAAFSLEGAAEQLREVWTNDHGASVYMPCRGQVKGQIYLDSGRGRNTTQNTVRLDWEMQTLVAQGLFDTVLEMFRQLVEWAEAAYACVRLRSNYRGDGWYSGCAPEVLE